MGEKRPRRKGGKHETAKKRDVREGRSVEKNMAEDEMQVVVIQVMVGSDGKIIYLPLARLHFESPKE